MTFAGCWRRIALAGLAIALTTSAATAQEITPQR